MAKLPWYMRVAENKREIKFHPLYIFWMIIKIIYRKTKRGSFLGNLFQTNVKIETKSSRFKYKKISSYNK